jgi:hypothetical protein
MNDAPRLSKYRIAVICLAGIIICATIIILIYFLIPSTSPNSYLIATPMVSIFSSFIGSFLVAMFFDIYISSYKDKELSQIIESNVIKTINSSMGLRDIGIVSVQEQMIDALFADYVSSCKEMFILQTYAPNTPILRPAIQSFLDRGGILRVALVSPKSSFVDIRWPEVNESREDFLSEISNCFKRLKAYRRQSGKIIIGWYNRSPGITIYGTDKIMMVGTFLSKMDSVNSPYLILRSDSYLYNVYIDHFERIWHDAEKEEL